MDNVVLHNSAGEAIAFMRYPGDKYLFSVKGTWIGWFPWSDDAAVTRDGEYLGTVLGDRLYREENPKWRSTPFGGGNPGSVAGIWINGRAQAMNPPFGYDDVPSRFLDR